MRTFAFTLVTLLAMPVFCYSVERTEAQRYYDLALSYIKSDLYADGLKTLNQVAFLYPDSDVADDALYELALIREQVGNGELDIARGESLQAQSHILEALRGELLPDVVTTITAIIAGEMVFNQEKERAVAQYLLALDYLNTLLDRYPESDRRVESHLTFDRIVSKIDRLVKKPKQSVRKRHVTPVGLGIAVALFIMVNIVIWGW